MSTTLKSLKLALATLKEIDPRYEELGIGRFLPAATNLDTTPTLDEFKSERAAKALSFLNPTDEQLILTLNVVKLDLEGSLGDESPIELDEATITVAPGMTIPEVTVVPSVSPVEEDTVEPFSPAQTMPSAPSAPRPEPAEATFAPDSAPVESPKVATLTPKYDQNVYMNFDPGNRNNPLDYFRNADGTATLSWDGGEPNTKQYVVAADDMRVRAPGVAGKAAFCGVTLEHSIQIPGNLQHIVVFEFDNPPVRGSEFGRLETVGTIENLELQAFEGEIKLEWKTAERNATLVVVRTKIDKGVPGQPFERAFADFTNAFWSDKDATITKGDTYSYEIWLKKQSGNRWIESNHLTAEVVVSGSIPVLLDFKVTETGIPGKVDISYRKPAEDNVEVNIYQIKGLPSSDLQEAKVMTEKEPRPATSMDSPEIGRFLGKKINLDEKPEFNEGIVTIRGVSIPSDEVGSRTFSAVSTLGGNARISAMFVVYQIGRMEGAEIIDRYDYQLIRVQLPMEASLLQVWIANPEDTWEQQDLKNPTREVYIQSEYLKNGGILFTDSDSTLPASVTKLDNSPKRIFIRGTANYEGNENPSPNVAIVDYKGRIEVHHRLQAIQEPAEKKGWLRKAEVGPVVNQVQVKVVAPSGSGSTVRVLALVSNKSAGFQIRTNSPEVSPETLNINTTQHINWMPVKTGISGEGSFLQIGLDKQVRLVPQNVADNLIPVFVIDEDIDNAKLKLPKPNPAEKTYKVILVGTKKSGKTTYVQALVNYLKNQLAPRYEASLEPKSPAANRRLIDLEAFLASGKLPESTPKASQFGPTATDDENDPRTPIRFNLEGSSQVPFTTIELFDVAGEDMNNGDIALYKNELLAADLIIFLFDPMQVKEFVERAPGSVTEVDSTVSPRTVLNTIHDIVVGNADRRPNQKIAVTVSKFDALGVVIESGFEGSISKGMSVTRDPNSWVNRFFNERDALQVQQEAIALLAQVPSNKAFTAYALENFDNLHFFVASSLGQDNWGQYIDKTGMTSFRIADPILWMAIPSFAVSNNPGSQPR